MSTTPWKSTVPRVEDGQPVNQDTANLSIDALASRTDWLKSRLELMDLSSGKLSISGATLDPSVLSSDWVYLDPETGTHKKAVAELDNSNLDFMPTPASSARVVGLVVQKFGPAVGTILMIGSGSGGVMETPALPDFFNLLDADDLASMDQLGLTAFIPGDYYLSATTPGKMTREPKGAPVVFLGTFSEEGYLIKPWTRQFLDGHIHQRFSLHHRPASRTATSLTTVGFDSITDGVDLHGFVSYAPVDGSAYKKIQLSIKRDTTQTENKSPRRVAILHNDGVLDVSLYSIDAVGDETLVGTKTIDIPSYGEWVAVNWPAYDIETDILFSIIRVDSEGTRYSNTAAVDIGSLTPDGSGWEISSPGCFRGWTNVDPLIQMEYPNGAQFRYIVEGQSDLYAMMPIIPTEDPTLMVGGVFQVPETSWLYSGNEIFWLTDMVGDWDIPWSENHAPGESPEYPTDEGGTVLSFSTSPHGMSDPVVRNLTSKSKILTVKRLGSDAAAATGPLELGLDLKFAKDLVSASDLTKCLADISPDGESFVVGSKVSELVAGTNITLRNVATNGDLSSSDQYTGKVRIDAVMPNLRGASPSFSLFNAKETERNGIPYLEFLPPASAATAAVARIPIPIFDSGGDDLNLTLAFQWIGSAAGGNAARTAITKLEVRVVRPGLNISTTLATPGITIAHAVEFGTTYSAFEVGTEVEVPVALPPGSIEPGDQVFVRISREINSGPEFQVGLPGDTEANGLGADDYAGRIGLISLKWEIQLV